MTEGGGVPVEVGPDGQPLVGDGRRSRRRRNVVGSSPHREEYVRLLKAGWSSLTLERYAAYRYGEDIPASTFRAYRKRCKIPAGQTWKKAEPDQAVDVLGVRAELIALQRARIAIDWQHEQDMNKLFGTTKAEIAALSSLLDAHKADLQDVGLMPKAGTKVEFEGGVSLPQPSGAGVPAAQSLGDLLGGMAPETEMAMARVLHLAAKDGVAQEMPGGNSVAHENGAAG